MASFRVPLPPFDWVPLDGRHRVPLFYSSCGGIVQGFVQYALVLASKKRNGSEQAFKTALDDLAHHLGAFQSYLDKKKLSWLDAHDAQLTEFRGEVFVRVQANPLCRSEMAARRTTNRYLRTVYRFLLWAQEDARLLSAKLGWPEAPIKTLLVQKRAKPQERYPANALYPLCFEKCGQGSRYTFQYVATRDDIDRLLAHFFDTQSLVVAERNALMMAVADQVGWRQGSFISLATTQFGEEALAHARAHGFAWVTPSLQKFGYENCFEVPLALVERIRSYIKGSRHRIIGWRGRSELHAKDRLFLNSITAEPLSPRAGTQIFSRAFRRIGAPAGAGAHSLRRKFADEKIEVEIAVRKRENRSTDPVNVGVVLQRALGQSSIRSQESYARAVTRATSDSVERRQQVRIQHLEHEIAKHRATQAFAPALPSMDETS